MKHTSATDFLNEFKKHYYKTKSHNTKWSNDLLASPLLKSANLTVRDEQLVKATNDELKFDIVKTRLIKIFSDTSDIPTSELTNLNIKPEPTFHAQNHLVDQSPMYKLDNVEHFDYQKQEFPTESPCGTYYYSDTFFNRNRIQAIQKKKKKPYQTPRYLQRTPTQPQSNNSNCRIANEELTGRPQSKLGKNPLDRFGNPMKCAICHNINH